MLEVVHLEVFIHGYQIRNFLIGLVFQLVTLSYLCLTKLDQAWIYLKEEQKNVSVEHRSLMRWEKGAFKCNLQSLLVEGHSQRKNRYREEAI